MKKRFTAISNMLFISAAILSLAIGMSLGSMLDFSRSLIGGLFPVSYDVQLLKGDGALLSGAEVVFKSGGAVISSDSFSGVIPPDDAIFTCTDRALLSQNVIRSGMLFALLALAGLAAVGLLLYGGFATRALAAKYRRKNAIRLDAAAPNAA